jgi:hypothetical protein
MVWDDPLIGLYWTRMSIVGNDWAATRDHFADLAERLAEVAASQTTPLNHALALARFLAEKLSLRLALVAAYASREVGALQGVVAQAEAASAAGRQLAATYREQWLARNKPQGLEVIQIRMAGQIARIEEAKTRVEGVIDGTVHAIPELDEPTPETWADRGLFYRHLATASTDL